MKKSFSIAIGGVVLLAAALAVVSYREGWFNKPGVRSQTASAGGGPSGGEAAAGGPAASSSSIQSASGATGQGVQYKAPQFDGNVAALDWGGKVESATGVSNEDRSEEADLDELIDGNKETHWTSPPDTAGPKEIVVSFVDHEPVLIDRLVIVVDPDKTDGDVPREVEVWVSDSGPTQGFSRIAAATLPAAAENTIHFDPVEARFVKLRVLHAQDGGDRFEISELKVMESSGRSYQPLLARRPDLVGPQAAAGESALVAARGAIPACVPLPPAPAASGRAESKHVLVLAPHPERGEESYAAMSLKNHPDRRHDLADVSIVDRVDFVVVNPKLARPWMLSPKYNYDTVVMEQICDATDLAPSFKQALLTWVAAGHKLIMHDADKCSPGPDYGWLPYRLKTDNPGAQGAAGDYLRFVEQNWMAHGHQGRPGFVDVSAWENSDGDYHNELGDSNLLTEWDAHWCGHMVVRNTNNIFGFVLTYAHYGRGLIIYGGFDIDQQGSTGYDLLISRELAQGFDPDNLPCSARIGDFVVTTDARLMERPLLPGRSYDYPLTLLSNQGYKGTVGLSVKANPGLEGMQASFAPASVNLNGLAESQFTLTLPANAKSTPQALEVKGLDVTGKTNTLCLQLVQPSTGELAVVSTLARPTATRKNLEIILDASGSMKTPLGRKTRWSTAHDVLRQVLATLPVDFNVGLRIYGHRESSRSAQTCTDSELVVPIQKLDQQALLSAAEAVKPRGETPLVYSVLQAPADLKEAGGGTVIVITDGEESCHGDPTKAVAQLKASGLDITLNIVGFTTGQVVQKQLGGFAQATGGRFYAADNGPALARALQMAAVDRFPYSVLDATGKEVAAGEAGSGTEELAPGEYTVVVNAGTTSLKAEHVHVELARETTLRITQKNDQFALEQ